MSCPTVKKAFEDSLNKEDLNNTDKFLVFENGTVYNVTYGDIAVQLGTTGSLTSVTGGGAIPILTGTAPDYEIRGLVGGNGISAIQNISGSITLNANLGNRGNAAAGERVLANTTGNQINLKRIKAGSGIGVASDGDSIIITNGQALTESNTVVVASADDFPAAVGGVITLASDTSYQVINDISTSNRFVFGSNTILQSDDSRNATLTYTGTGNMLTFSNGAQVIKEIGLACPNGTLFNNNSATGSLLMRWVLIAEVNNLGTLGKDLTGIYNVLIELFTGSGGFVYETKSNARLIMDQITTLSATNAGLTFLDLADATFDAFNVNLIEVLDTVSGQTFLSGEPGGANMAGDTIGYVSHVVVQGDMAALDTITLDDPGFDFNQFNILGDTDPHCLQTLDATATTTIAAVDTPVIVNGAFTTQSEQQFDGSAAGRATYLGKRPKRVTIGASLTARPVANTKDLSFYFALNGTVIAATAISREIATATAENISLIWSLTLNQDDYIEVFVENNTDDVNVQVQNLVFEVN